MARKLADTRLLLERDARLDADAQRRVAARNFAVASEVVSTYFFNSSDVEPKRPGSCGFKPNSVLMLREAARGSRDADVHYACSASWRQAD